MSKQLELDLMEVAIQAHNRMADEFDSVVKELNDEDISAEKFLKTKPGRLAELAFKAGFSIGIEATIVSLIEHLKEQINSVQAETDERAAGGDNPGTDTQDPGQDGSRHEEDPSS